jgi:hypothetical protein
MNYLRKDFTFNGTSYNIDTEFLFDSLDNEIEVVTHSLWNNDTDSEAEDISIELHQHIEQMMMDVANDNAPCYGGAPC